MTVAGQNECGIPVTQTWDVVSNQTYRLGSSGFPLFSGTGRGTITFTSDVTGKSASWVFSGGQYRDFSAVDNMDGTFTRQTRLSGVLEKMVLSDRTVLLTETGTIVFANVVDDGGTPSNPDDDQVVDSYLVSSAGKHPDLESGFTLWCRTFVAAVS